MARRKTTDVELACFFASRHFVRSALTNGKVADTIPRLFDYNNGTLFENGCGYREDNVQAGDHVCRSRVSKPEHDDTDALIRCRCRNLAEVQVKRQDDAVFIAGFRENVVVGQPVQPFLTKVGNVMSP